MAAPVELLTPRERECLRLVHAHLNSKQIARELGIQPATVDRHCENAARKLNAIGRVDAALLLVRQLQNDSVSGSPPIVSAPLADHPGVAKGAVHDQDQRPHSRRDLESGADHPDVTRGNAGEEGDGSAPGRGDPQTVAVSDAGGLPQGDHLHRSGDAGRALPTVGIGPEHLGRILIVLAIAAFVALVMASILGAERFAFLLQGLRYGN